MDHARQQPPAHGAQARAAQVGMLGLALLMLAACASTPPPLEQMAVANAALAHAAGAGSTEGAPAEMALARDKMNRANLAMTARDHDTALTLAQQVLVDAQLAEAKTEAARSRKSAQAVQDASRALREELARKTQ